MAHSVYIGLGSNLDNPLNQVKSAILEINALANINLDGVSDIYKSKPLEIKNPTADSLPEQADYINAVIRIKTSDSPDILFDKLQALELKHKRLKEYRWGPRSLDLDILLYADLLVDSERLTIPHPELINRDFVLYPLNDINPELDIPKYGKLAALLENMPKDNLVFVEHYIELQDLPL